MEEKQRIYKSRIRRLVGSVLHSNFPFLENKLPHTFNVTLYDISHFFQALCLMGRGSLKMQAQTKNEKRHLRYRGDPVSKQYLAKKSKHHLQIFFSVVLKQNLWSIGLLLIKLQFAIIHNEYKVPGNHWSDFAGG